MSAGGQNSSSLTGIQGMCLRDSSDVTNQLRVRQFYQEFNPITPNAIQPRIKNSYGNYLQFLQGYKEVSRPNSNCVSCVGLPYNAPNIPGGIGANILEFTNTTMTS